MNQNHSPLELERFLPYRLSILSNQVSQAIADEYQDQFSLAMTEWRVMAVLARFEPLSAREVAEHTAMDKVAVSRAVAGLIELGYLERKAAEEDGRRSKLYLTRTGQSVYDEIVPMAMAEEQALEGVLTPEERLELTRLMEKLAGSASPGRPLW